MSTVFLSNINIEEIATDLYVELIPNKWEGWEIKSKTEDFEHSDGIAIRR